jgi:hypothetical protein
MNIGNIVSTVQSEPLEDLLGEEIKAPYEVLVNEEITPEIKEDIFA